MYPADLRQIGRIARCGRSPLDEELLRPSAPARRRLRAMASVSTASLVSALSEVSGRGIKAMRSNDSVPGRDEVMACALARTVGEASIASIGSASILPTVSHLLAKLTRVPGLVMLSFNGGLVDVGWRPMTLSFAELLDFRSAATHAGGDETYHWYYQQGRVTHEVVGTAQLDPAGTSNTIAVTRADGGIIRLPGQGGMADVANLHANFLLYLPRHDLRSTVDLVDVRGASRAWHDPGLRRRYRLAPGRTAVFTELGEFEFDSERGALVLTRVHQGVDVAEVQARTGWPLTVADDLKTVEPPDDAELSALRGQVDPLGIRRLEFASASQRQQLIDEVLDLEDRALARAIEFDQAAAELDQAVAGLDRAASNRIGERELD